MLELERFFQSDKNLCLSLATLISRENDKGRPIGIKRKNPAANFQIVVTDDFKLQASAILLQRVSAEFLLTSQEGGCSAGSPHRQIDSEGNSLNDSL